MKPLIGITLDYQTEKTFSSYPWYALRVNYFANIANQGGLPFGLHCDPSLVDHYLETIDGLIVSGGNFDIDPSHYGEEAHAHTRPNPTRTNFEITLLRRALNLNMPVLGICGGHQLLNVALGGSLIQYIPEQVPGALSHMLLDRRHEGVHPIDVQTGTWLSTLSTGTFQVNSSHQQAVNRLGQDLVVNALSPDGIIEGIESTAYDFCAGIQWHPEFLTCDLDQKILKAFVDASKAYALKTEKA